MSKRSGNIKSVKSWNESLETEVWIPPSVDIFETEEEYILEAEMPGVSKDKIKIQFDEAGYLIIMGRINYEDISKRKFILQESERGNFYRKFKIADSIDENKVIANLENGVLSVALPKHEKMKPRIIDIK